MEVNTLTLKHQNWMWAVRREMGWPPFKPCNDAIAFGAGRKMDLAVGVEIARLAQAMRKDLVYSGWPSTAAVEPDGYAIAYRELLAVDVVDRCFPFAADETGPMILVSTRADEHFAVGRRGFLERLSGKPKHLRRGRALALRRIRAAAAAMGDELAPTNVWVPAGAEWVEPPATLETVVRFG